MNDALKKVYDALIAWRNQRARELGYPPANVLNNRQIREIVELQPRSKGELKTIFGIGNKRVQQFGQDILTVLAKIQALMVEQEQNHHENPQHGTVGTVSPTHSLTNGTTNIQNSFTQKQPSEDFLYNPVQETES